MNVNFNPTLPYLKKSILDNLDHEFDIITTDKYIYCKYNQKINIFTFGKLKLNLPFTIIAPPISIDDVGFNGDIDSLIEDLQKKSKFTIYLFLNLRQEHVYNLKNKTIGIGHTLSSCILNTNDYSTFDDYKNSLRSQYRRRLNKAIIKAEDLVIDKINNHNFDENLYNLYLQVLEHNEKYKLETLPIDFFKNSECEIYTFKANTKTLAFVMINHNKQSTYFIFGGLDYEFRDKYDLYYNMLIFVIKNGIENKSSIINFGQTAEDTKCRLGCKLNLRYMICFSSSLVLNFIINKFFKNFDYKNENKDFNVFKN